MLNPPLSLLSDDLFRYIVDHVAELPSPIDHLCSLSIADRAFTRFCQDHIFKVLCLGYNPRNNDPIIPSHLAKIKKILNDRPSFANSVRAVNLTIPYTQNAWIFNDATFISMFQLLAKSLMPPHKLHLSGLRYSGFIPRSPFVFEDPILIVGRLNQTFFSQTLTVLHLTYCKNVPLTLFLICPGLREILLDGVRQSEESYDKYPDGQCSGRDLPTPDTLEYRYSGSLINQMITPPPRFHKSLVIWSKLRVLTLCPDDKEGMVRFQHILDDASNTLEELYLTKLLRPIFYTPANRLPLAGLVNLKDLSYLRVFALYAVINYHVYGQISAVLHDINLVLSTIPTSNKLTNLTFKFGIWSDRPFRRCLEEDWAGLCDQVIRISGGKPLKLTLDVVVCEFRTFGPPLGEAELCERINEKIASLSEYPNICTQFASNEFEF